MTTEKNKEVFNTEYAVEIRDKNDNFVVQIDIFKNYKDAYKCVEHFDLGTLDDREWLNIIFIDYNKNGEEINFGTVC